MTTHHATPEAPKAVFHSRAKAGGQFAPNGEWYKGGAFINTVPENPKGEAKKRKPAGKRQVELYKWELQPFDGAIAIFPQLSGIELFDRTSMQFRFNGNLRGEFATPLAIARREKLIAAYNRGERWL